MDEKHRFRRGLAVVVSGFFLGAISGRSQTAVWIGGSGASYSTPANWQGGVVPPNTGTYTLDLGSTGNNSISLGSGAVVSGLLVQGTANNFTNFSFNGTGSLSIGSGGITLQSMVYPLLQFNLPVILAAPQTWYGSSNGYVVDYSSLSGAGTLTVDGRLFIYGVSDTNSGGIIVDSQGVLYPAYGASIGSGLLTLQDGSTLSLWYQSINITNSVSLGNNVKIAGGGSGTALTLSGTVTAVNAATTLDIQAYTTVIASGVVSGPASTVLTISGNGAQLPVDGGSQLLFTGSLSQVTGVDVDGAGLILAPSTVNPVTPFSSLSASGLGVGSSGYLGLDGTFSSAGSVVYLLSHFGPSLGSTISGTLGFDTVINSSSFGDAINLTNFTSAAFLGLGSSTSATLTGTITPGTLMGMPNTSYVFGGGGGTLTVTSNLADFSGTSLIMTAAPAPLTLILQGSNAYTGGTVSNGGVLIFNTSTLPTGGISLAGGYVGDTETSGLTSAGFMALFNNYGQGVMGFDQAVLNLSLPRPVTDAVDMTYFNSDSSVFIGTSTAADLSGSITPANHQYQFTGVKGGRLTIDTQLGDVMGATGLTLGLVHPIESNGSSSVVNLTGDNSYTGGTTFNSGTVFFTNNNSFGLGPITVTDPGYSNFTPYFASYGGSPVTISNPISFGNIGGVHGYAGLTVGNAQPSGNDMLVLSGVLSDNGGTPGYLAIAGPVTLSGMNTYTGGTSIDGQGNALVLVTNSSSLGALNGPTLGQVAVQAQAVLAPTGGNVTLGNPFDLISSGGPLTLGRSSDQTDVLTLTGIISGYSQLVIDGPVVLSGNNTYSGGTIINDVNLAIGSQNALGSGSVELTGSSSLTEAYMNPTIDDLSGDPGSTVGLSSGSTLTLYSDYTYPGYPALFYGSIGGDMTNAVVKTGPGAQLIGGDSTYAGGTTVSSGILIAGGNNALGTGPVTVASGAQLQVWSGVTLGNSLNLDPSGGVTLGGNGTFSPGVAVNIASGNTVAPGRNYSYQFNGTLSFGAPVTFGNGGIYDFNVQDGSGAMGVGYTTMDVTGAPLTLSISGSPFQIVVTSIDPSGSGPGFANFNSALSHSWTLVTAPSIAGTFSPTEFSINLSSFQNPLAGGSFSVGESLTTLTLNFTPVPEPSTWLLMAVGLAAVLVQMRRSKRA